VTAGRFTVKHLQLSCRSRGCLSAERTVIRFAVGAPTCRPISRRVASARPRGGCGRVSCFRRPRGRDRCGCRRPQAAAKTPGGQERRDGVPMSGTLRRSASARRRRLTSCNRVSAPLTRCSSSAPLAVIKLCTARHWQTRPVNVRPCRRRQPRGHAQTGSGRHPH